MQKKKFDQPPKRVALFVTCMVDMMYPNVGMATVELLERHGVQVVFPEEQTCCGQPAFNAGYRDESRQLARRFIDIFEPLIQRELIDAVVAPSGSCVAMTSHFYTTLFEESPSDPYLHRAERLAAATFELTEFLVDVLGVTDVNARLSGNGESLPTLTYHACCHLLRELRVDVQPRTLLSNVQGATMVELDDSEGCCGFGGLFSIKNAGISTAIGQRKVQHLRQSGADMVAMCDVSCMTHINGLLKKQGQHCRAVHIAEVLNQRSEIAERGEVNGEEVAEVAKIAESKKSTASAPRAATNIRLPNESQKSKAKDTPERTRPRRWQDY